MADLTTTSDVDALLACADNAAMRSALGVAAAPAGTLVIASGKTFTANSTITFSGTDGTTHTLPATSQTLAGLGVAQTFTATQTIALSVTGSGAENALALSPTWNTSGAPSLVYGRVTNTASGSNATLIDVGITSSLFVVRKDGALRLNGDTSDTLWRRSDVGMAIFHGNSSSSTGIGSGFNTGISCGSNCGIGFTTDTPASTRDAFFVRGGAATIQLGANHATTATAQTLKAHNVTTGTGASLTIAGGTGSTAGGAVILATSATTGAATAAVTCGADGSVIFDKLPSSAVTLGSNGRMTIEFTDNTTLTFRARGSDGTTRTATLTLA